MADQNVIGSSHSDMVSNQRRKPDTVARVRDRIGRDDPTAEWDKLLVGISGEDPMHDSDIGGSEARPASRIGT